MMLYEVRRAAVEVAEALRRDDVDAAQPVSDVVPLHSAPDDAEAAPAEHTVDPVDAVAEAVTESTYAPLSNDPSWSSYLPNGTTVAASEPPSWS
jgi:hypothetical protein